MNHTTSADSWQYTPDGWPVNPATGQPYRYSEIIHNPAIPYPTFVDAANPGPHWQRRETQSPTKRTKRRRSRAHRSRRSMNASAVLANLSLRSSAEAQAEVRGRATAELVERVNSDEEVV